MSHFQNVCEGHGIVVQQCRCPGPRTTTVVPRPDDDFHREQVAEAEAKADDPNDVHSH